MQRDVFFVNDIYPTIQGEGHFTGTPSVFVRLQGCDVGCPWCDTKYTWKLDNHLVEPSKISDNPENFAKIAVPYVIQAVEKYRIKHVVITGGEPAKYDLTVLSSALIRRTKTVQVETSGTHDLAINHDAWVTVSPKYNMRGGYKVLETVLYRANEIKFPIASEKDAALLESLLKDFPKDTEICLQPISQNKRATQICVDIAMKRGMKLSLQTHKYIDVP
jgi:7-carboxy-7-deazaguanine synthase